MFSNRKAAGLATQITSRAPFVVVCLFIFDSFIISHHSACRLRPCALQSETIWRASAYKFYSFMTFRERGGCSDVSSFPGLRAKALMTLISASFPKTSPPPPNHRCILAFALSQKTPEVLFLQILLWKSCLV